MFYEVVTFCPAFCPVFCRLVFWQSEGYAASNTKVTPQVTLSFEAIQIANDCSSSYVTGISDLAHTR